MGGNNRIHNILKHLFSPLSLPPPQNPQAAEDMKKRMEALKEDPELRPILEVSKSASVRKKVEF